MIAAPAVDLKGGRCVQLVGGRPDDERVSLPDPLSVAERWYALGFGTLHVVDLDAAMGSGDNLSLLGRLLVAARAARDGGADTPAPRIDVQVGGGIRDDTRAEALLRAGADRIIVGTRAIDDPDWLARLAERHPRRVMVALDTREGRVLRKGWTEESGIDLEQCFTTLARLPLAGILSTDVGREGRLEGIDREACTQLVAASPHPLWISGGVTTLDEMAYLDAAGAAGVVLGMALYTETIDPREAAARWGAHIIEETA